MLPEGDMGDQQSLESWNTLNYFDMLPEGCIADTVSYTTPLDACQLALVASSFRLIADSDIVWERFLPSDYQQLISRAVLNDGQINDLLHFSTKKKLYLYLCDHPLIIDGGALSFSLDKQTGKKCFMVGARELGIAWGDTPTYWRWTSDYESRFGDVIELIHVCWFHINGKINTSLLSPDTVYTTYLVYKPSVHIYGFKDQPIDISVGINGEESINRIIYLEPKGRVQSKIVTAATLTAYEAMQEASASTESDQRYPRTRKDGWLEVELAEYYNNKGENRELEITLKEVKDLRWKRGLIIQGIEIRPKVLS